MSKSIFVVFQIFTLLLLGCSTLGSKSNIEHSLTEIEILQIGSMNQAEALTKFGAPNMKVVVPPNKTEEAWLYFSPDSKSTRFSLIFETSSGLLVSKTWFLRNSDSESKLSVILSRFKPIKFQNTKTQQQNPHFIPDEEIFSNSLSTINFVYRRAIDFVESISWSDPNRRGLAKTMSSSTEWSP